MRATTRSSEVFFTVFSRRAFPPLLPIVFAAFASLYYAILVYDALVVSRFLSTCILVLPTYNPLPSYHLLLVYLLALRVVVHA